MGKKSEATLVLKVKSVGQSLLKRFRITLTDITNVAGAVVRGIKNIAKTMGRLALDASKAKEVEKAFRSLALSQGQDAQTMLKNMEELSVGTISRLELMKQANNALLLGLPVERFGDMLQIARSSAKATGESMQFMLKSIVTGLGRGSKLILDNLGIVVNSAKAYDDFAKSLGRTAESLSDAEKKTAFINAALAAGKKNADAMGNSSLSLQDGFDQLKAAAENIAIAIGTKLIPAMTFLVTKAAKVAGAVAEMFRVPGQAEALQSRLKTQILLLNELLARRRALNAEGKQAGRILEEDIAATNKRIELIQKEMAATAEKSKAEQERIEKVKLGLAEEQEAKAQAEAIERERELIRDEEKKENNRLLNEALKEENDLARLNELNSAILNEKNKSAALLLIAKRHKLKEDLIAKQKAKSQTAAAKFDKFINSEKVKDTQSTLSTISSLQNSNSKALVAIGKAAAIANIVISTARGVAKAFELGPILGPILAPIVATAGAAQAAKVAGVNLAEGGIVQARPGGVQATIGEGGQDEAVIPLEDAGGGIGNNITIVVNGGLLGDEQSAREFAIAVDQELLSLRQNNESLAFDSDFV